MRVRPFLALALLAMTSGCGVNLSVSGQGPTTTGSGVVQEEIREVAEFHELEVSAKFEATVTIGPKTAVTLSLDDNLLPLVTTEVKQGRLVVAYKPGQAILTKAPQKVMIVVPTLDTVIAEGASKVVATVSPTPAFEAVASGAATIEVAGVDAESVTISAVGASKVQIQGKGRKLKLNLSGASKATVGDLAFETAQVGLGGASSAEVHVTRSIEGNLSGASKLVVRGKPATRAVQTSGASSVSY